MDGQAAKVESDRLRKLAEDEGDRLFAEAEAALAAGNIDGAREKEKAATAAYESRKIARTTTLRALRSKIKDEALRVAQEEAARKAEEARVAQMNALQEKQARAAEIQAKSGTKLPLFLASQMADSAGEAPAAPTGPPKLSPELRAAAQMTGAEMAAAKKKEMEEAQAKAKQEAKEAADRAKQTVDTLVAAADEQMKVAGQKLEGLLFAEAREARDKAEAIYKQAGVNRSASLKNMLNDIAKSEKKNAAAAKAAEKKRIADEKAAAEAAARAEAAAAQKLEVARQVEQIKAAASKQSELSAKGGVKVPLFVARQALSQNTPDLKPPPPKGGLAAPPATSGDTTTATAVVEKPAVAPAAVVESSPPLRAPPAEATPATPVAAPAAPAASAPAPAAAAAAVDDTPMVDFAAKLEALKKERLSRLDAQ
jgi:hypothetical protein